MERKIGEVFIYDRKKLQIVEQEEIDEQNICKDCYFDNDGICRFVNVNINKTGGCCRRDDRKSVIFKEIK